ncbi:MAG: glucokinase [Beijerinckiaceae bacterium]|nr:glucokinase [Beijerinckiaceae bacterium]
MEFPFPVLLCDIGGTNARFSLLPSSGAAPVPGPHLKTGDFPSFEVALEAAGAGLDNKPRSLIACAAGPVIDRAIKMTNADWTIDGVEVAARAGLDQGLLLNDFEAQAFSLPFLKPSWLRRIGPDFEPMPGTRIILGLGTGLGVAALLAIAGRYFALASEAGHMDFGPLGPDDEALWPQLDKSPLGRVCAETILSGPGLMRLHCARCAAMGIIAAVSSEIELIETARAQPQGQEAATLRHCWRFVARFAGDLALVFLAKGGVTLSGGVLPRIVDFCDPASFRAGFEDKAPYGQLMKRISTQLIAAGDTVFCGMAAIALSPDNFAIDYPQRAWR